ncbi:MAG TPA: substrate-binding domain-containing protein [Gammaproteobacteria bacterium]
MNPDRWPARLVLALLLTLALGASQAAQDPIMVGFSQDTFGNDWRLTQVRELEQAFASLPGYRLVVTNGMGNTAKQIGDIEDLLRLPVDILIASPRDAHAMTPVLAKAYRAGTPVILLTRTIASNDYTTLIAADDAQIARDAAHHMVQMLKGRGTILMLQGVPSASTAVVRTEAFEQALKPHPQLRISARKVANYLRADAVRAVEEVLAEQIPFDAIYAQSDSMASGARVALKKAGIDPASKLIVGIDYIREAQEAIRGGEQAASFLYPTCSREAGEAVKTIAPGKRLSKRIVVDSQKITRANVERVSPIF